MTLASLAPLSFIVPRLTSSTPSDVVNWAGNLYMGLFMVVLSLSIVRDALLAMLRIFDTLNPKTSSPVHQERRNMLHGALNLGLLAASGTMSAVGYHQARTLAKVVDIDVTVPNLPPELDGFKIVQVSDIHVGPTIKRPYLEAIINAVNELDADMIAITGDLVDGYVEDLRHEVAPIAGLKARHGAFFVTGNHEYYWDALAWEAEVERLGITVLSNRHHVITHAGQRLVIAGVTDYRAERILPDQASDPQRAMDGAPEDAAFRLMLAHQPLSVTAVAQTSVDLQLSGHTHGGQFFPINFFVGYAHPFTAGLHAFENMQIYVSRGTGYWGPPMRVGAPSEITVLRLKRA